MNYIVVPHSAAGDNGVFVASAGQVKAPLRQALYSQQPPIPPGYERMIAGAIVAHTVLLRQALPHIAKRFAPQSA
jgi:hypothetical protein